MFCIYPIYKLCTLCTVKTPTINFVFCVLYRSQLLTMYSVYCKATNYKLCALCTIQTPAFNHELCVFIVKPPTINYVLFIL